MSSTHPWPDGGAREWLAGLAARTEEDDTPRPIRAAAHYAATGTLAGAGKALGITREAVRRACNDGPYPSPMIRAAIDAARDEERDSIAKWSHENLGATIDEGERELGIPANRIRAELGVVACRIRHRDPAPVTCHRPTARSREQLTDDLLAWHSTTGRGAAADYAEWARDHGIPGPQTHRARFGSWVAACTAAGIPASPRRRSIPPSRANLAWDAVVAAARDGALTADAYERWSASRPGAPSVATVATATGGIGWTAIRERVLELLGSGIDAPDVDWESEGHGIDLVRHVVDALAGTAGTLTVAAYDRWAAANDRPVYSTIRRATGLAWRDLLREAGAGEDRLSRRGGHRRAMDDDVFLSPLRAWLSCGGRATTTAYDQHARSLGERGSRAYLERFGSWQAALAAACATEDRDR